MKALSLFSRITLPAIVCLAAGCAAAPQIIYVPYPPSQAAAPAPPAAPPAAPQPPAYDVEDIDRELSRSWRELCMLGMRDVALLVEARNTGIDYTVARDYMLTNLGETLAEDRPALVAEFGADAYGAIALVTADLAQRIAEQVYRRPYGTTDEEQRIWLRDCLNDME